MLALSFCAGPAALSGHMPIVPAASQAAPPTAPAAQLAPSMVWLMLARRAVASECYGEALRCFDNALHHDATLAIAHLGRAMSLAQLDREAEAREATEALIENAEGQEEVLYQLARMCAREGRVGFGVALLTQAVLAQPRLEDAAVKDALFADHPAYLQALGRL